MDRKICKITIDDIEDVLEIEESCFHYPWDREAFVYEKKENPFSKLLGIKENDKLIGYIDYWITFDSSTIAKIAVIKEKRNLGLGSLLLQEMEKDLKANNVSSATLEVRKSNVEAKKLYEKNGFIYINTKVAYYENGEDALYYAKGL